MTFFEGFVGAWEFEHFVQGFSVLCGFPEVSVFL